MAISIDVANADGGWVRVTQGIQNQQSAIKVAMAEIRRRFGGQKVRAVDDNTGATVQILGYPGQEESR